MDAQAQHAAFLRSKDLQFLRLCAVAFFAVKNKNARLDLWRAGCSVRRALDYNHLFFTQKDVDAFTAKFATALDDDILLGKPDPAFEIYDVFQKRVEDRIAKVKEEINRDFDFTAHDAVEDWNRQKAPWPK